MFCFIFGRPFVTWFALCYRTVVCLSVTLVYCGQTVGWIKMKHGMLVGLGPSHIGPPKKGGTCPLFSAHIHCGQTAGWIKMPLGMEVGLSPSVFVLDGTQLTLPCPLQKRRHSPQFSAHVYCGQTVAHVSYC